MSEYADARNAIYQAAYREAYQEAAMKFRTMTHEELLDGLKVAKDNQRRVHKYNLPIENMARTRAIRDAITMLMELIKPSGARSNNGQ